MSYNYTDIDAEMEADKAEYTAKLDARKTIAIDFDGVLHKYSKGWQDGSIYDDEMTSLCDLFNLLLEKYNVFIFSTRSPRQIKNWIEDKMLRTAFLAEHPDLKIIPFYKKFWKSFRTVGITKRKLPAHIYIDDRAYKFEDWNKTLLEIDDIIC